MKQTAVPANGTWIANSIFPIGLGIVTGLVILSIASPFKLLAIVLGFGAVLGTFVHLEWGLAVLVFLTYTRFSDVLIHYHGAPSIAQPFVGLLVFAILFRWSMFNEKPVVRKSAIVVVVGYGLIGLASLLYAPDMARTQDALSDYAKDAILIMLVMALLQRLSSFHRAVWALLAAGIFMGTISVYQYLTGTLDHLYGGFAQAEIQQIVSGTDDYRIAGPVGDPNFYAQILLVILPLALDRLCTLQNVLARIVAIWALLACGLSIIFTFSRGALFGLGVMLGCMMIRRPTLILPLLLGAIILIPVLPFIPSQYVDRLKTFQDVFSVSSGMELQDSAIRGRLSENIVGWLMFTDHPLLGVGLDNYPVYYQRYARNVGLETRLEERPAHNLYLQIAAETGVVGLALFGTLLWVMFRGIQHARARLVQVGILAQVSLLDAFSLSLIGYLAAALFLHPAYPRFFWLLVGIAFALPQAVHAELSASPQPTQPPS